jgi:uncharacterized protein with FMN-binding domain
MRRAPIVVMATAAGVAGVLVFHTTPSPLTAGILPSTSGAAQTGRSQPGQRAGAPGQGSVASGAIRTVHGASINYYYGALSVSVTVTGNKITKVGIASLNDGGAARSQFIDQQSIPVLEQEALQAQSANIQGVSGASYTSAGFQQSLQSALRTLRR